MLPWYKLSLFHIHPGNWGQIITVYRLQVDSFLKVALVKPKETYFSDLCYGGVITKSISWYFTHVYPGHYRPCLCYMWFTLKRCQFPRSMPGIFVKPVTLHADAAETQQAGWYTAAAAWRYFRNPKWNLKTRNAFSNLTDYYNYNPIRAFVIPTSVVNLQQYYGGLQEMFFYLMCGCKSSSSKATYGPPPNPNF